ncbi:MAG: hypothetical protein HYR89_08810, partial [Actinobacteria bacterium]|nr:hypothetical protein [Actinomycetota bacterium]
MSTDVVELIHAAHPVPDRASHPGSSGFRRGRADLREEQEGTQPRLTRHRLVDHHQLVGIGVLGEPVEV